MPDFEWRATAVADLAAIGDHVADDDPDAAKALKHEIEEKASRLTDKHLRLYRVGRVDGTREMVVRPDYVVIYAGDPETMTILRVRHAAQQWPEDLTRERPLLPVNCFRGLLA